MPTDIDKLVTIMDELREKCPWDRQQTIQTLRQQTIEELYELTDAIDEEAWQHIKEELGDLLLHIVFYARIASEKNEFHLQDVVNAVCDKLIRRHPHIYGDTEAATAEAVKKNWEKLKLSEGNKSILSGVPTSLPSLIKAMRLQNKAAQVGFEWKNKEDVWKKVEEEKNELHQALTAGDHTAAGEEAGDLLFSIINYIRFLKIDADHALESTNKKFIHRFKAMEAAAGVQGKMLHEMALEEMDAIWNEIKSQQ